MQYAKIEPKHIELLDQLVLKSIERNQEAHFGDVVIEYRLIGSAVEVYGAYGLGRVYVKAKDENKEFLARAHDYMIALAAHFQTKSVFAGAGYIMVMRELQCA